MPVTITWTKNSLLSHVCRSQRTKPHLGLGCRTAGVIVEWRIMIFRASSVESRGLRVPCRLLDAVKICQDVVHLVFHRRSISTPIRPVGRDNSDVIRVNCTLSQSQPPLINVCISYSCQRTVGFMPASFHSP